PLQPILVSLYRIEKLLKGSNEYNEIIEPLQAASEELKHLTRLADRFSELAKLPSPNTEKVDLCRLLHSIAELYQEQLADYGFTVKTPDESVYVEIDPTYFREALHNLLQNAIDASPKGSAITVEITGTGNRVDIIVQDFGRGMSAATISSARLPYFTTRQKGNGLGLAIVEKVITEGGGQLSIDSEEGCGTRVTISLPLKG
ncbi:MAG: ATP-binding protein, partial [candidate division Zixibacteria bacterium]|nr:ATP-binding protein [candidate division Zixibacteria bacterium]